MTLERRVLINKDRSRKREEMRENSPRPNLRPFKARATGIYH